MAKRKGKFTEAKQPELNEKNELSIIGLSVNLSRAYEIAKVGNFTLSFGYYTVEKSYRRNSTLVTPEYCKTLLSVQDSIKH